MRQTLSLLTYAFMLSGTLLPNRVAGQSIRVTGSIYDQTEKNPLSNAVVSFVYSQDSVLAAFGRSNEHGIFSVSLPASGKYIIRVTYPKYADYLDQLDLAHDSVSTLRTISLIKKADLLDSVIVRQKLSAIHIKGDTTVYMADSFLVNKGASVGDLLKRLPGIRVDHNGTITAQGEEVKRILVDGEEFFADDPAMVTENLSAGYVKEIQVYNKKSEQSELTGIDDGKHSKTINLKLKPEMKKGYSAKATVGGGTRGTFDNSAMATSFKASRQLAAFGIASNTGQGTLNYTDRGNFGGKSDIDLESNGSVTTTQNLDDELEGELYVGDGLPTTWTAGAHYAGKWNDQQKGSADYRFMKRNATATSSTRTQYILPDTQYFSNETRRAYSTRTRNSLSGNYNLKPDSTSLFKVTISGNRSRNESQSSYSSEARNADSALVNENARTVNAEETNGKFATNLRWQKKLRKKGRSITALISEKYEDKSLNGLLLSNTNYYRLDTLLKRDSIDQKKMNSAVSSSLNSRISYTESLSKRIFLSLDYYFAIDDNTAHRNSFNKAAGTHEYTVKDSAYSNDFRYNYLTHSASIAVSSFVRSLKYTFGAVTTYQLFHQTNLAKDSVSRYSFINIFPTANVWYIFSEHRSFLFNYRASSAIPTPDQLQPVRENTNPLNIQIGNPNLRQQYTHYVYLYYYDSKESGKSSLYANASGYIVNNAISSATSIDAGGKSIVQAINVNGDRNAQMSVSYSWQPGKSPLAFSVGTSGDVSREISRLNAQMDVSKNQRYSLFLSAKNYKQNKYDFSASPSISFVYSKSSLRPDVTTKYFTMDTDLNLWIQLPWKASFKTNATISVRQKTDVFDVNKNVIKWDASIGRKFGKSERAELNGSVNDILNQNIGFTRYASGYYATQNTYNTFKRYAMLRFTYNFSTAPAK